MYPTESLLQRIESLRKEMTDAAFEHGFTSIEVISLSQELDRLLNQYNNMRGTENIRKTD